MKPRGRGIGPGPDALVQFERERGQALRATVAEGPLCGRRIPRELSNLTGGRFSPELTCAREVGHWDSDPGASGAAHYHHGPDGVPRWSEADCNGDIAAMVPPRRTRGNR